MANYYGRTCGCGCGVNFETHYEYQKYLNNAHRQAHNRVVVWARKHTIKYLGAMYGDWRNAMMHWSPTYYHYYRLGIEKRGDRYCMANDR